MNTNLGESHNNVTGDITVTSAACTDSASEAKRKAKLEEVKNCYLTLIKFSECKPEATIFTNARGEVRRYYFKNNPWKLSEDNDYQKIFRYCVICGTERFTTEKWSKVLSMWGQPPTICKAIKCWDSLAFLPGFVKREHYLVKTEEDQLNIRLTKDVRATIGEDLEFFEKIEAVTSSLRQDNVFKSEEEMPKEFVEIFRNLEKYPVESRISEIDSLYFEHCEKNSVEVGTGMADTTDPYLLALVDYRQKSYKILNSFRSSI